MQKPVVFRSRLLPYLLVLPQIVITTDESLYTAVMGIQRMVNSGEDLPVWHYTMGTAMLAMIPPFIVIGAMQKLFVKGLVESEK